MAQQHTPYDDQIEMYYAAGQKLPDGLFHKREGYLAAMDAYADLLAALEAAFSAIAEAEDWNEQIEDADSRVPLDTREKLRRAAHQALAAIAKATGLETAICAHGWLTYQCGHCDPRLDAIAKAEEV